ncbi:MAG: hypothetical protein IT383_08415 [Deltaproteobacteria bacterium]|nr:hypothetical protein [Deltaproteobacteria bacterium]
MLRILTLALILAASTGCFTMNAAMPGTLRTDVTAAQTEKVGTLTHETTNWFYICGLLGSPPEDVFAAEIKKQCQAKGADGVANLTYEAQTGCLDFAIGYCTFNIITPRSYKLTGDLVRIKASPLPGKPAKSAAAPGEKGAQVAQAF